MARYTAVVETGFCSMDGRCMEVRRDCGHRHLTVEAAERCGEMHYASRYVRGSWQANADWHGYTIHVSGTGMRVSRD